jgi:hypothetical protein
VLASTNARSSNTRLALLFFGAVLARGRRTVTSWIRAARLCDPFRPCYTAVSAKGNKADGIAARMVLEAVEPLDVYGHDCVDLALLALAPGVGRRRPAAAGPDVRPQGGPGRHRPEAQAVVAVQPGTDRRVTAVGQDLAGAAGQAILGGGRGGYAKTAVLKPAKAPGMTASRSVAIGGSKAHSNGGGRGRWPASPFTTIRPEVMWAGVTR